MRTFVAGLSAALLAALLSLACGTVSAEEGGATFSQAELDQMVAPIALYPDSLLSQILMASTYPADVAEAVTWSKNNPDQKGDTAVEAVQSKSWDPSVMSLVAFPQVLAMMGKKPDWVQNVGDAFLAAPESVMDAVQQLRSKAKDEGNLESTEQQKIIVEQPSSTETIIIIEPADPKVVYVPTYNPTIIYGTWWWPHYTPYYYYPPGWGFGSAVVRGIGFGIGIHITNSLWGGCRWGRGHSSININVNRYNSININSNRLNVNKRNTSWNHNSNNRRGVPYRDQNSRQKYDRKLGGADQRKDFRGRDADRAKARATLEDRGIDPAKQRDKLKGSGGREVRESVRKADRDVAGGKLGGADRGKTREAGKTRDMSKTRDMGKTRDAAKNLDRGQIGKASQNRNTGKSRDVSRRSSGSRNNALSGAGNAQKSNRNVNRGTSSNKSMRSHSGGGQRSGGGRRR